MKNLYEQLSEEKQNKVQLFKDEYPTLGELLIKELNEQYAVSYMTITRAIDLNLAINGSITFDLANFFNLFEDDI